MSQSDSTNEPDEVEESYVVTNIEARFLAASAIWRFKLDNWSTVA
jgi:hypothetical protein